MTAPTTASVWSQLSDDLRRFIRRRVADDHTADDLLQETFLRIHRGIGALEDAERLTGWVYRIARNAVHDHYRQVHHAATVAIEVEPADDTYDHRSVRRDHAARWFDELIRELPDRYQEAVRLAELEGLSQQEVADRLGLSLSGAKSRIQRGRALLKDELDRCCTFEFDRRGNLTDCDPKPTRTVCLDCNLDTIPPPVDD